MSAPIANPTNKALNLKRIGIAAAVAVAIAFVLVMHPGGLLGVDRHAAAGKLSGFSVVYKNCINQASQQGVANGQLSVGSLQTCTVTMLESLQGLQVPSDTVADLKTYKDDLQQFIDDGRSGLSNSDKTDIDFVKVTSDLSK